MMCEKRYTWKTEKLQHSDDEVLLVVDNENKDWKGHILNIVDRLNEQQFIIEDLQDLCGDADYENAQLRLKNKKLQDKIDWLCEKYDYPNNKGVKK
jgi:hypothetical protein